MDNSDIELDDIDVVEVTGSAHHDAVRKRPKRKGCGCRPSLRDATLLIFLALLLIYVIVVIIENVIMQRSFEDLEVSECRRSVNRVSVVIATEMDSLKNLVQQYSFWDAAVEVAVDHDQIQAFVDDNFMVSDTEYNTDLQLNFIAFLDNETFETWWSVYYPPPEDNSEQVAEEPSDDKPLLNAEFLKSVAESLEDVSDGWQHIMIPGVVKELFLISVEPIMKSTDENDETIYGFLVAGRNLKPRLQTFSNDVPTCLAVETRDSDGQYWDSTDRKMFDGVEKGTFKDDNTYGGEPVFTKRDIKDLNKTVIRVCPEEGVNETSQMMTGYFELCDMDPDEDGDVTCVKMRLDNPMSMMEQGSPSVTVMSIAICLLMVILCCIFAIFLDCVVLQPVVNLSKVLEKQANWEDDGFDEDDEKNVVVPKSPSAENLDANEKKTKGKLNNRDEISKLKRAMEKNASGLRRRLKAVDRELKAEQRKTMKRGQAIQLLNLWRGHNSFFPGLRPNAMQLRYEPPRDVDDLLNNPLAIEFLKSHCETDSTVENLWFLLDVSWLEELEKTREHETEAHKRNQLQDLASGAAATLIDRYISPNAPQPINISAETRDKLREKDNYERGMFAAAVNEVKMVLSTDVLPRFQKTPLYSAMSEALFINSSGGEPAEGELSEDSASTAGSILTDDAEDDGGVARVFAKTFKNLHTNFASGTTDSDYGSVYSTNTSEGEDAGNDVGVEQEAKEEEQKQSENSSSSTDSGIIEDSLSDSTETEESLQNDEDQESEKAGPDVKEEGQPKKDEADAESGKASESTSSASISSDSLMSSSSSSSEDKE